MFIRRDRQYSRGLTFVRVGIFFFAAGMWLAGVTVGNDTVTSIAIVVAAVGLLLGWAGRPRHPAEDVLQEEDEDWQEDEAADGEGKRVGPDP